MADPSDGSIPITEPETGSGRRAATWTRWDWIAISVVTLLGGIVRFVRLDIPKVIMFDETYYAKDACWYVNTAKSICEIDYEQTYVHPPLGKWLIALGIRIFGQDSFGWRVAAAVAGTITIALLYLLAKRLLKSTLAATLAAGLLAIDLLHFVQSRIAMLDVFVPLFGIAAVYFAVLDRDRERPPPGTRGTNGLLDRPWRIAAGACAGAAVACKWAGAFYLVMVVFLMIVWEIAERRSDGAPHPILRFLREETLTTLAWLVLLPIALYMFTYAGRLEGNLLAGPLTEGSWWKAWWDRQLAMLDFHADLTSSHSYQSSPWTWPFLKRPVSYYIDYGANGEYGEVMATGSPFVWWASILAIVYATFRWIVDRIRRRRQAPDGWRPEGLIVAGVVFTYFPWMYLAMGRPVQFIFYMLPTVPFMCLALAYVATEIGRSWEAKAAVALFTAGALGFFGFYYPVTANVHIAKKSWDRRIWIFDNCDKPEPTPTKSTFTETLRGGRVKTSVQETSSDASLPPKGWCWI